MKKQFDQWNNFYKNNKMLHYDNWLEKHLNCFSQNINGYIIDLGCGNGGNSIFLFNKGCKIIACDYSSEAIDNVKLLSKEIDTRTIDFTEPLPFENNFAYIIIADLVLHYFAENKTKMILDEIHRITGDGGFLFARVNSTKDLNFGAGQGDEIERNYYYNNGSFKRFFDEKMIDEILVNSKWEKLHASEYSIDRYGKTEKVLWEIILKKRVQ